MNSVVLKAALVSVVRRSEVRRLAVCEAVAPRASWPPTSGAMEVLMGPPRTFWLDRPVNACSARADIEDHPGELRGGSTRTRGTCVPYVVVPRDETAKHVFA